MERQKIEQWLRDKDKIAKDYNVSYVVEKLCKAVLTLHRDNAELEERLRKATALVEIKTAAGKDLFDLLEECEIKLRKAEEALKGLKQVKGDE